MKIVGVLCAIGAAGFVAAFAFEQPEVPPQVVEETQQDRWGAEELHAWRRPDSIINTVMVRWVPEESRTEEAISRDLHYALAVLTPEQFAQLHRECGGDIAGCYCLDLAATKLARDRSGRSVQEVSAVAVPLWTPGMPVPTAAPQYRLMCPDLIGPVACDLFGGDIPYELGWFDNEALPLSNPPQRGIVREDN